MAEKNSFVIYKNWATIAVNLPEELAGQLFKAICSMQLSEDYEIKDPAIKAIFASIIPQMTEDAEKWEKKQKQRTEAVKSRWEKGTDENEEIRNDTNVSTRNTDGYETIQTDSVNVNGTVNVNANGTVNASATGTEKESGNLTVAKRDIAAKAAHSFRPPTEDEVRDYCREHGYTHTRPDDFVNFYGSKGWMVGKNKMADWHRALAGWESREKRENTRAPDRAERSSRVNDYMLKIINTPEEAMV
jgi:acylphosphatase